MSRIVPTTSNIAAAYRLIQLLPPFDKLALPPAEEVTFEAMEGEKLWGQYDRPAGRHRIRIGPHYTLTGFLATVAHEMLHLHQEATGVASSEEHNKAFRRLVRQTVNALALECGGF